MVAVHAAYTFLPLVTLHSIVQLALKYILEHSIALHLHLDPANVTRRTGFAEHDKQQSAQLHGQVPVKS